MNVRVRKTIPAPEPEPVAPTLSLWEQEKLYQQAIEDFLDGKVKIEAVHAADPYKEARAKVAERVAEKWWREKNR